MATNDIESNIDRVNVMYQRWRKNVPLLYDLCLTHSLIWPSLTIQWFSSSFDVDLDSNKKIGQNEDCEIPEGYESYFYVVGNQASEGARNYIAIEKVIIPKTVCTEGKVEVGTNLKDEGEYNISETSESRIVCQKFMKASSDVHRARIVPKKENLVAIKTKDHFINVLDVSKTADKKNTENECLVRLEGHEEGGWGMDWSTLRHGYIASGSNDSIICVWDALEQPHSKISQVVHGLSDSTTTLQPLITIKHHKKQVEGISWSHFDQNIFLSASNDKSVALWDLRTTVKPSQGLNFNYEVSSIAFSPFHDNLFLAGTTSGDVSLWDLRKFSDSKPSQIFRGHRSDIFSISWAPCGGGDIFATCGSDRRVLVWDRTKDKLDSKYQKEPNEEKNKQIMFIHGGHTAKIYEFDWCPQDWTIASTAADNIVQIWHMNSCIYNQPERHNNSKKQKVS